MCSHFCVCTFLRGMSLVNAHWCDNTHVLICCYLIQFDNKSTFSLWGTLRKRYENMPPPSRNLHPLTLLPLRKLRLDRFEHFGHVIHRNHHDDAATKSTGGVVDAHLRLSGREGEGGGEIWCCEPFVCEGLVCVQSLMRAWGRSEIKIWMQFS